jgi:hypothetical protein
MGFASARRTSLSAGSCGKSTRLASSSAAICSGGQVHREIPPCPYFMFSAIWVASFPVLTSHKLLIDQRECNRFRGDLSRGKAAKGRRGQRLQICLPDGLK